MGKPEGHLKRNETLKKRMTKNKSKAATNPDLSKSFCLRCFRFLASASLCFFIFSTSALGDDLESLLDSVDEALAPEKVSERPKPNPDASQEQAKAPRRKRKTAPSSTRDHVERKSKSSAPAQSPTSETEATTTSSDSPEGSSDFRTLLNLATLPSRESSSGKAQTFAVAPALTHLMTGLSLYKDDDAFVSQGSSPMKGAFLQFSPSWRVSEGLFGTTLTQWLFLGVNAGFFGGDISVRRTGVVQDQRVYPYFYVPVSLDFGSRIKWRDLGFEIGYGFGVGFVSQRGDGQTDTITSMNVGDALISTLSWKLSPNFEPFLQARLGSVDIFERSNGYAANSFLLGLRTLISGEL